MGGIGRVALGLIIFLGASARADDLTQAKEHYRKATKAYEVAQYDEAIREFAEAYKLKDDPSILFNLAQAHRLSGHRSEALRTYRMFLSKVPNAPNRRDVEVLIESLQQGAPTVDDPDSELSRRYFQAGAAKYAAQDYPGAVVEFEKARVVKPSPALDFNIARAYDRLGRNQEALAAYQRYLASNPADADEIRARVTALEQRLAREKAAAQAPASAPSALIVSAGPPPDRHAGHTKTLAGIAVGVVGVAGIAGGIACGVLAQQAGDDLTKLDQSRAKFDFNKESQGVTLQTTEGVLLGIGGAAVVTGVVLVIVGQRDRHRASRALAPIVGPRFAGLEGRF